MLSSYLLVHFWIPEETRVLEAHRLVPLEIVGPYLPRHPLVSLWSSPSPPGPLCTFLAALPDASVSFLTFSFCSWTFSQSNRNAEWKQHTKSCIFDLEVNGELLLRMINDVYLFRGWCCAYCKEKIEWEQILNHFCSNSVCRCDFMCISHTCGARGRRSPGPLPFCSFSCKLSDVELINAHQDILWLNIRVNYLTFCVQVIKTLKNLEKKEGNIWSAAKVI